MMSQWLEYGDREITWLSKRDKKLGAVIAARQMVRRSVHPDPFPALLHAVIGQQISGKAQESIWNRFQTAFAPITPVNIAAANEEAMRACGISRRKGEYLRGIAHEFAQGELHSLNLEELTDEELRKKLLTLRGIGPWTVEMLMIFTFQRKNVLSFGDLAIIRGMRMLYGHRKISREIFDRHYRRYSPYATVASIYLWEIASGNIPGMEFALPQ